MQLQPFAANPAEVTPPALNANALNANALNEGMAALSLSSISNPQEPDAPPLLTPRTPRPRSGKMLQLLQDVQRIKREEIKQPTGDERAADLQTMLADYSRRRDETLAQLAFLKAKEALSPSEKREVLELSLDVEKLDAVILKIHNTPRKSALTQRRSLKNLKLTEGALEAAVAENRERYVNAAKREYEATVQKIATRLSRPDPQELEALLTEIRCIVNGEKSEAGHITSIPKSIEELFRTAATTEIKVGNEMVQHLQPGAHDRSTPANVADTIERFLRLYQLFQRYSGDDSPLPDVTGWSYEKCSAWAARQLPLNFTVKMRKFLRSTSQSLYTGPLSQKYVLAHAPNDPTISKGKLYATVAAGSQELQRHFCENGESVIRIMLPYELRKLKNREIYATLTALYTITFDTEMEAKSLNIELIDETRANSKKPS